jgi:hypothetical protein
MEITELLSRATPRGKAYLRQGAILDNQIGVQLSTLPPHQPAFYNTRPIVPEMTQWMNGWDEIKYEEI